MPHTNPASRIRLDLHVILTVSLFYVLAALFVYTASGDNTMQQQEKTFTKTLKLDYLLFLPQGYDANAGKEWPLILFLHGAGERGSDLSKVKVHGIPKIVEQQPDFPFIAVSPQCPEESWWPVQIDALNGLLDEILATYKVDETRVYLTGLSMGGYGTWAWATAFPERFAAIAPVCGGGNPAKAAVLNEMPTWVFHGAKDSVVSISQSEEMVEAIKAAGGDVRFTVYPEAEHDSWTETYANPDLYTWFLEHRREVRRHR